MHQRDRFALGKLTPPAGGNGPQTEGNFAHGQVRIFVRVKEHGRLPKEAIARRLSFNQGTRSAWIPFLLTIKGR